MKSVSAVQVEADIDAVLDSAQKERIIIIRAGKPSAVIVGVESYDEEDLELASSPEFWRMIEKRRQGQSIPLAELKARLRNKSPSGKQKRGAGTPRKKGNGLRNSNP